MKRPFNMISMVLSFTFGALTLFLLDPSGGRRRRHLARDKAFRTFHEVAHSLNVAARDLSNRTQGLLAEMKSYVSSEEMVSDDVLEARVRSQLGHIIPHAGAIEVSSRDGRVFLKGSLPRDEIERVESCVESIQGVREIENQLVAA